MAVTDIEMVQQELNRRYAAPLPEFYKRRIIFWHDEDREFEDRLDELEITNAKIVRLTGTNHFAVKKLLCHDDMTSNFLVYSPLTFEVPDDNWLLNVELYSEEFRADRNSIWMDDMGLPPSPVLRNQIKHYRKFFNNQERRAKIAAMSGTIATAAQMHLAVMAVICGNKDNRPDGIIRAVLTAGLDIEKNEIYRGFVNYGAQSAFRIMVQQATGYNEGEDVNLGRLAAHILFTTATRTMHTDNLSGLERYISTPHQAYCYDFVSDWLHSEECAVLYEIARVVEQEAKLPKRFEKLEIGDIVGTECFPCVNECILTKLMTDICNNIIDVDAIRATIEKRRTFVWYDEVSCFYEGLLQVANMQEFYLSHADGFHIVEPQKIWKFYTEEYYRMDTFYRQFQLCFQKSIKLSEPLLDDAFKQVAEKVEGLYTHWFVGQLGQCWTNACAKNLEQYGRILEIPQQLDFYNDKVRNADSRVFIIVSDALRYEVAASLAEQLRRSTQSTVELNSCEAVFPTITKFGMAALLPHQELSVVQKSNGSIAILADGQSTEANNRDKVLKSANPASVALKYDNIIGMKRADRSAFVKGMEVVYFYHDKIDEASHTADSAVFPACDEAIDEIKNLVRIIVNEFGGTNIIITSDHGFLYTYSPLAEDDKLDKTGFADELVEYGRRYAILPEQTTTDALLPVKFLDSNSGFSAFAPRENVRIKMNGGGLNFVHGGASLQEMVVPVIDYHFLRSDYAEYQRNKDKIDTKPVEICLLSASRKICNMIFALNFYQKDAVGDNREATNYLLYFVDTNGSQISDTVKVIADKTSDDAQDRAFRCTFNLRSQKYSNMESYYLVIADESGLQAPVKEEFQIDIAFSVDEFNFF